MAILGCSLGWYWVGSGISLAPCGPCLLCWRWLLESVNSECSFFAQCCAVPWDVALNLTSLLDLDVCLQPWAVDSVCSITSTVRYLLGAPQGTWGCLNIHSEPGVPPRRFWGVKPGLSPPDPLCSWVSSDRCWQGGDWPLSPSPTDTPHTPPGPPKGCVPLLHLFWQATLLHHVLLWARISMMASRKADLRGREMKWRASTNWVNKRNRQTR